METYWVSCKKNTVNQDSNVRRTEQYILMLVSNCTSCSKKKLSLIKNQEASGLLSILRIRTPSSNIPLMGDILC